MPPAHVTTAASRRDAINPTSVWKKYQVGTIAADSANTSWHARFEGLTLSKSMRGTDTTPGRSTCLVFDHTTGIRRGQFEELGG